MYGGKWMKPGDVMWCDGEEGREGGLGHTIYHNAYIRKNNPQSPAFLLPVMLCDQNGDTLEFAFSDGLTRGNRARQQTPPAAAGTK